jgi:hypothetical protein
MTDKLIPSPMKYFCPVPQKGLWIQFMEVDMRLVGFETICFSLDSSLLREGKYQQQAKILCIHSGTQCHNRRNPEQGILKYRIAR